MEEKELKKLKIKAQIFDLQQRIFATKELIVELAKELARLDGKLPKGILPKDAPEGAPTSNPD